MVPQYDRDAMTAPPEMLWSDAWILLATIYVAREQPAALDEVIGAADYIQHAIVTFEEMEGALHRLTASGFLSYTDGKLAPSEKAAEFYASITRPRRSAHAEQKDLEKFIGAQGWSGADPRRANQGAEFPELARSAFDAAVATYLGRMKGT